MSLKDFGNDLQASFAMIDKIVEEKDALVQKVLDSFQDMLQLHKEQWEVEKNANTKIHKKMFAHLQHLSKNLDAVVSIMHMTMQGEREAKDRLERAMEGVRALKERYPDLDWDFLE